MEEGGREGGTVERKAGLASWRSISSMQAAHQAIVRAHIKFGKARRGSLERQSKYPVGVGNCSKVNDQIGSRTRAQAQHGICRGDCFTRANTITSDDDRATGRQGDRATGDGR